MYCMRWTWLGMGCFGGVVGTGTPSFFGAPWNQQNQQNRRHSQPKSQAPRNHATGRFRQITGSRT